jgi:predicted transcriptional regulator
MKITTRTRIVEYLKSKDRLVSGTELEAQAESWFTKSSTIDRTARNLSHEGLIHKELNNKRCVQYRYEVAKPVQHAVSWLHDE